MRKRNLVWSSARQAVSEECVQVRVGGGDLGGLLCTGCQVVLIWRIENRQLHGHTGWVTYKFE